MAISVKSPSSTSAAARSRRVRPALEGLEDRLLLYSTLGAHFVYGSRITFSFVPDGANIGGCANVLNQTLNARFPTATWQLQFQKAAAVWQAVANINISQVGDDGSPLGADGNQQGDPRFGDIRISAIPQAPGTLATCFLPPPINGGSDAGDIILNSNVSWQINSTYDLETVAIHEIGHALGMGHSQITYACMYAAYNGMKQSLTADDTSGIQSVWLAPQPDRFNSNGVTNATFTRAANITSFIDADGQISIPNLRLQTGSQVEWFSVTVPSTTTGTMVATVQSSNLSLLSPKVTVYSTGLSLLGTATTNCYGGTVSVSIAGVQPGQTYLIRANGDTTGDPSGGFGLQVNFGSTYQPPISPPDTSVPPQPDQGGGGTSTPSGLPLVLLGNHFGYGETLTVWTPVGRPPTAGTLKTALASTPAANDATTDHLGMLDVSSSVNAAIKSVVTYVTATVADLKPFAEEGPVLQALDRILSAWESGGVRSLLDGWEGGGTPTVSVPS